MSKIPVFICGGHFSPALAVIEELLKHENLEIFYIGRKFSQPAVESLEYKEIRKLDISFLTLETAKINRFWSISNLAFFYMFPFGVIRGFGYIRKYRPGLVVSFGSYVALPVSLAAKFNNIPVITHEQTRVMGLSNRIISFFSKYTCITFPQTKGLPFFVKPCLTGMPIRSAIINPVVSGITDFGNRKLPLIYITGGSQGSAAINGVIYEIASELLKRYRIIHACGESRNLYDYRRLVKKRQTLDKNIKANYYLMPYIKQEYVGEIILNSSLIISRSGANTVFEIGFHRKRAILIPLPWSANNEQLENARYLEKYGNIEIISQNRLKPDLLLSSISQILERKVNTQNVNTGNMDFLGTGKLISIIDSVLYFRNK